MFRKILIANRGEIACRVIDTCRRLNVATVAVYSDADRHARHVALADEAVHIGAAPSAESYLAMDRILAAAKETDAQAIHPGFGFLSENSEFARRCEKAGVVFIGPKPESMDAMASKSAAKSLMEEAGVPVTPGYHGEDQSVEKLEAEANRIGFPMMIKATAGGGGKGMRVVHEAGEFRDALEGAKREAKAGFGDDKVLLEKYITEPRHIEFQVFGDAHGNAVHVFERECTLQRRFQKVVEETPSPFLNEATRAKMGEAAVAAAKAVDYINAGTIEFIVGADKSFHFMEMNTRLQVEHPITEETTGLDLVEWQLRIADGEKIPLKQPEIKPHGHAIEVRLYAENADKDFLPATGHIEQFLLPEEDYVRADTGVRSGDDITIFYDPMIAKIVVTGHDRAEAIERLRHTLARTAVFGVVTNLPLLRGIARHPGFAAGDFDTGFIERELESLLERPAITEQALAAALAERLAPQGAAANDPWRSDGWRLDGSRGRRLVLRTEGGQEEAVRVHPGNATGFAFDWQGTEHYVHAMPRDAQVLRDGEAVQVAVGDVAVRFTLASPFAPRAAAVVDTATRPVSPMPGRVVAMHVKNGDSIEVGQPLMVLEGMKMEYTVKAGVAGTIEELLCAEGDMMEAETPLVNIEAAEA
jgi:3-methylcrotonyl-CoA carboxylase alpha subunit